MGGLMFRAQLLVLMLVISQPMLSFARASRRGSNVLFTIAD